MGNISIAISQVCIYVDCDPSHCNQDVPRIISIVYILSARETKLWFFDNNDKRSKTFCVDVVVVVVVVRRFVKDT